jgi:hypothetical protein
VAARTSRERGLAVWIDRAVLLVAVLTGAAAIAFLSTAGRYYLLPLWERPDSPLHRVLRPSGSVGHLIGIAGTVMVLVGVLLYSTRKRLRPLQSRGPMRTWLNVHIYLCLAGPMLVTFHTALKFGGFAAYSYWSMMIVAASGIVGRWLYQQFPRTIRGRELSLQEIQAEQAQAHELLRLVHTRSPHALREAEVFAQQAVARIKAVHGILTLPRLFVDDLARPFRLRRLRSRLVRRGGLPAGEAHAVIELVRDQVTTARRLAFLGLFRRLFLYWHVTHLVFFVAMLVMLVLHVGTVMLFGVVTTR